MKFCRLSACISYFCEWAIPQKDEIRRTSRFCERSPLSWDVTDPAPAAKAAVALLSDWFPKTTGEIIHVDGGLHAMGA